MWYGQVIYQKKKYRTGPYPTKTQAKDALNQLRIEVKRQTRKLASERVAFMKFADEFMEDARLKNRNYESHVYRMKHLGPFFRERKLDEITRADVHAYTNKRLKEGATRANINRELACLKRMLNVAIEWGRLAVNPMYRMPMLKEDPRPVRSLTPEEQDRLLTYCRHSSPLYQMYEPIVIAALHTGMRQSELLTLKWEQVDFGSSIITLPKTKGKKIVIVPMNEVVTKTILALRPENATGFVFPFDRKGKSYRSKFKYHWGELCKKVGLQGFRFHDLRATFATRLNANGVGGFTIQRLLGHSTMAVTNRYINVDESSRRAVETLANGPNGQKNGQNSESNLERKPQIM